VKNVFLFLEAALETVPAEIARHPAIKADARRRKKKPYEIILDDSKHHSAMKNLRNREKRGRPDILHHSLLLLLDSPASEDFEIYIHTIHGTIIYVNSRTRLPRNYNRFIGLMEDLFKKREIVANNEVLLKVTNLDLEDVVLGREVIVLSEKGEFGEEYLREAFKRNFAVCVGAFPHGDFSEGVIRKLKDSKFVSLGPISYTSLYVTSKILCVYERIRTAKNN